MVQSSIIYIHIQYFKRFEDTFNEAILQELTKKLTLLSKKTKKLTNRIELTQSPPLDPIAEVW